MCCLSVLVIIVVLLVVVNEVGVGAQIADQGMAFGEVESALFSLFTNEPANVFDPVGTVLECLAAGCIQDGCGMFVNEPAQRHNGTQRLGATRVEGPLGPLTTLLTQYRRSVDPITAGGQNRGAQAACSQGVAELAGLPPSVHPNLFHALVKDPYATAIPSHPDFAANQFGGRFVKSSFYFHVTVPMHTAPSFLEAGKKRLREWLEGRPLLFKTGSHLLARRAMDALVGDTAFPITKEEVFLGQGLEAPALESIVPKVGHSPLHLTFVLRHRGTTRHDVHAVVPAEVSQLRIDLRIKPVGLEHRRFHIVEVEQQGATAKASETVFQAANERLGILPGDRLAIALTRITQYQPQDPTPASFTLTLSDGRAKAEIQLELLPRLTFQAPDPLGMDRSQPAHKALYGLIGIGESGFLHQILVNALGT